MMMQYHTLRIAIVAGTILVLALLVWLFHPAGNNQLVMKYTILKASQDKEHADARGWILSPMLASGLAPKDFKCLDLHVGTILPKQVRGNHRHRAKTEVLFTWGSQTRWRIENPLFPKGYEELIIDKDQQIAVVLPAGTAHLIENIGEDTLYISGCADGDFDPKNPATTYDVWPDLIPNKTKT